MQSDYENVIEFYRAVWRAKVNYCLEDDYADINVDKCTLRHKCRWFNSPSERDLYNKRAGKWLVVFKKVDAITDRHCRQIPSTRIQGLKELLNKCIRRGPRNEV